MALLLTRKQSLYLGLGLLAAFFIMSGTVIYFRTGSRIPSASNTLSKEAIEGLHTEATPASLLPEQTQPNVSTTPQAAGFILNEFHRSLVRDGRTVWEVYGTRGNYSPGEKTAEIENPHLTISRKDDEHITITSGRAVLFLEGNQLTKADLFDDVVLNYNDKTTIRTSKATYDQTANSVHVPVHVEIDNDTLTITGNELDGNLETHEFFLTNGVTSLIKPRQR